jgi:hypothetical protein
LPAKAHTRRPLSPFDDPRLEDYCRARAAGQSPSAAATHAGYGKGHGPKLAVDPDVMERVRELRDGSNTLVTVSVGYIVQQLRKNAEEARDAGQFKPSNDALGLLYEIITKNKDLGQTMNLPAAGLTTGQAARMIREELSKPAALPARTVEAVPDFEAEGEEVEA